MWAGLINNRQSLYFKAIAAIVICLCGIRAYTHVVYMCARRVNATLVQWSDGVTATCRA